MVDSFFKNSIGQFPKTWEAKDKRGREIYKVRMESNCYFVEANARSEAIPIAKKFKYDLKKYPILSWKWRVLKLPDGADERYKERADSAAAIYVIFKKRFARRKFLKYVWSSSLPVGTSTESPYGSIVSKTKIIVLENRNSPLDKWISEEVNVYEDYKRTFGGEPRKVEAIGIMSDSDNTKSQATAHYTDIMIKQ